MYLYLMSELKKTKSLIHNQQDWLWVLTQKNIIEYNLQKYFWKEI